MPVIVAPREQRTVMLEILFAHRRDGVLTCFGNRTRRGPERESRPQPGVEIMTAERPLEGREGWFAGAVAGRDVSHFEPIAQGRDAFLVVRVVGHHQVECADDKVDARVYRG